MTCKRCPNNCKNCKFDGENSGKLVCTECDANAIGRINKLPDCACKIGNFDRGTIDCGTCISPCVTCETTRITCKTCVEGGKNRNPAPDCNCLSGFYQKDGTCLECSYTCKTCDYASTECLECHGTGLGRTTVTPDCACEDGWYDDGEDDCKKCEYPCEHCVTTSTNCTKCVFEIEGKRHAPPNCHCLDGEYKDSANHC